MHSLRYSIIDGLSLFRSHTILVWIFLFAGLYFCQIYSFLFFHSIVEIFSIAIAFSLFMIVWNSRRLISNNYLLLIGIAYFFIGWIDLCHTLAYKGMNIFRGFDANLPTQLWIAGRYMESISLFLAPLLFRRQFKPRTAFAAYSFITAVIMLSIFYFKIFPDCYIEGRGLTPFKVISEYIISCILAVSIILLRKAKEEFDKDVLSFIVWSILFTIGSELFFTFYVSVYGVSNLIGHYFKVASCYCMYQAIVKTGLEKPYSVLLRDLKIHEEALQRHQEELEDLVQERTNELQKMNEQLIELGKRIGETENIERRRISRELHDMVGQNLTALGINLNILNSKLPQTVPDPVRIRINDSLTLLEETTDSIRNVMTRLRPSVLDDYGLYAALRTHGEQFSLRTNINVTIEGEETFPRLNMYIEWALFRIAQEALNNVAKHAHASKVIIVLKKTSDTVVLVIEDNGIGFDNDGVAERKRQDKWGLTNMTERALSIGGHCRIESSPGSGTRIIVEVTP